MKKNYFIIIFISWISFSYSNNINVSNIILTDQDFTSDFTLIQFDISWDNSWRTSTYESNWDAAWVFVKWRLKTQTTWNHATLNTTGHTTPTGATITTPTDGKGIFIYKSANGIGTNTFTGAQIRWNYGVDGLGDYDLIEICVFATEMVYVPTGSFYAGDGTTTNIYGNFEAGTTGAAFQITSESTPSTLGTNGAGCMGNNNTTGMSTADDFNDATSKALPAAYPKGYTAFYMMKYEMTQEQYVNFLNKLTYTQQATRTVVAPNSAAGTGALDNSYRNGIDIMTPGVSTTTPAVYACNLDGDGNYNESVDGQNIPCNWISWADAAAYLDWSGLRPFTELEFEKACRGNQTPVPDEFVWGSNDWATLTAATGLPGISNDGATNEVASNASANCVYGNAWTDGSVFHGPLRAGCFAQGATNRKQSGGSYYGIMELGGNLDEWPVTLGNATGRAFTGVNGDGNLDATGDANSANWPGTSATGTGFRGGYWENASVQIIVSCRMEACSAIAARWYTWGIRGVRLAP